MRFSKYNNPNKKRYRRKMTRCEAVTLAGSELLWLNRLGYKAEPAEYQHRIDELTKED